MTKAVLCGLAGFFVFSLVWIRRFTGPWRFNAAVGVNLYKAVLWQNPLYWSLALTVAFACVSIYLALAQRQGI